MSTSDAASHVVLHVPHASVHIPEDVRDQFVLSDDALAKELGRLTDRYTDELFAGALPGAATVTYPVSRLVVDPERFPDDADEPAAAAGMGVVYVKTSEGSPLRRPLTAGERQDLLDRFHWPHHGRLEEAVGRALSASGRCLVLDCHSFPMAPLPTERSSARPDICIGTDPFHTPRPLLDASVAAFGAEGFSTAVNDPFSGTLVPSRYYERDDRVQSLMVEVGRWLYMDEGSLQRLDAFEDVRSRIGRALLRLVS